MATKVKKSQLNKRVAFRTLSNIKLIREGGPHHIETSPLISIENK